MKVNMMKSDMVDLAKKDVLLKTVLLDDIDGRLSDNTIIRRLKRAMYDYRDKNISIFSSPYITYGNKFSNTDRDIIFSLLDVNPNTITTMINLTDYKSRAVKTVRPIGICLLFMMRYGLLHNDKELVYISSKYLVYSFYYSLHKYYYKLKDPDQNVMAYVVNNVLTNKHDLKRLGSLDAMIGSKMETMVNTYYDNIIRANDLDLMGFLVNTNTRMNESLKKIASEYYSAVDNKNIMYITKLADAEGNLLDNEGSSLDSIQSLAMEYTSKVCGSSINLKILNLALTQTKESISQTELRSAIDNLISEKEARKEILDFYTAVFYIFFAEGGKEEQIKSGAFLATSMNVFSRGNTKDKNSILIKQLLTKWLMKGSATFRTTGREPTRTNYRRAIFAYLILMVCVS